MSSDQRKWDPSQEEQVIRSSCLTAQNEQGVPADEGIEVFLDPMRLLFLTPGILPLIFFDIDSRIDCNLLVASMHF